MHTTSMEIAASWLICLSQPQHRKLHNSRTTHRARIQAHIPGYADADAYTRCMSNDRNGTASTRDSDRYREDSPAMHPTSHRSHTRSIADNNRMRTCMNNQAQVMEFARHY